MGHWVRGHSTPTCERRNPVSGRAKPDAAVPGAALCSDSKLIGGADSGHQLGTDLDARRQLYCNRPLILLSISVVVEVRVWIETENQVRFTLLVSKKRLK